MPAQKDNQILVRELAYALAIGIVYMYYYNSFKKQRKKAPPHTRKKESKQVR